MNQQQGYDPLARLREECGDASATEFRDAIDALQRAFHVLNLEARTFSVPDPAFTLLDSALRRYGLRLKRDR